MPFNVNVLNDATLLTAALRSKLIAKIPVDRIILADSGLAVDSVFVKSDIGEEALLFVDRFSAFESRSRQLKVGISERSVMACVTEVTGMMWRTMTLYFQDFDPVFKYQLNDKDMSGATAGNARPDETDYLNDFMVCKSEHMESNLYLAIKELTGKLSAYNQVEYGPRIVYLPVIAAAGTLIEFAFVDVRTKIYHKVARYDIENSISRVDCFVCMINFFRLIRTMAPYIPENPTPFFKTVKGITYFDTYVMKDTGGNVTCPDALYDLLRKGVPGAVRVVKGNRRLKVTPLGTRTPDHGEGLSLEDVRAAVKTILLCLEFLHEKGFVHRDLTWANTIRLFSCNHDGTIESCKFLVIDFEFAERNGAAMNIVDYIHSDVIDNGKDYSSLHDLKLVGKMVSSWAIINRTNLDQSATDFINAITRDENPLSASDAQRCDWLMSDTAI